MQVNTTLRLVILGTVLALGNNAAFAKTAMTQNHHCKQADGTMDMKMTKKKCVAAKGTWAKDADAAAAPAMADPAPMSTAPAAMPTPKK